MTSSQNFSESGLTGESWIDNLNNKTFNKLTQYLSEKPEPIEIFDYVYGILHDPVYCEKYEQYLCRDFLVSQSLTHQRKLHLMQIKAPANILLVFRRKCGNIRLTVIRYWTSGLKSIKVRYLPLTHLPILKMWLDCCLRQSGCENTYEIFIELSYQFMNRQSKEKVDYAKQRI